jgi:hypothetical protein
MTVFKVGKDTENGIWLASGLVTGFGVPKASYRLQVSGCRARQTEIPKTYFPLQLVT